MGVCRLRCTRGCACEARHVDAHRGQEELVRLVSVYKTETFGVRLDAHGRCVLELHVLNRTRSGGHKFKVSEIALVARHATDGDKPDGAGANRQACQP